MRDHTAQGLHDIGGIQSSPQAGFPDDQFAMHGGKMTQSHHSEELEERWVMIGSDPVKELL